MPRVNLTDRFIASLKPKERVNYFDTRETGLVLRVTPNGTKSWSFTYRPRVGERKGQFQWLSLGEFSDLNSLADARQKARKHRHDVGEGRDPIGERRAEAKEAPSPPAPPEFSFSDLAALYETWAKGRKKTWRADVSKMKTYLLPAWGVMPLRSITRTHVHELLDTLVAKGMTVGVNRVQALISRLFTLALDRSLIDAHPASRMMKRFKESPVERVLNDDELRALWAGLDAQAGARRTR